MELEGQASGEGDVEIEDGEEEAVVASERTGEEVSRSEDNAVDNSADDQGPIEDREGVYRETESSKEGGEEGEILGSDCSEGRKIGMIEEVWESEGSEEGEIVERRGWVVRVRGGGGEEGGRGKRGGNGGCVAPVVVHLLTQFCSFFFGGVLLSFSFIVLE